MSSKNRRKPWKSLAFRLTFLYASLGFATLIIVSLVSYVFLNSALQRELDQELLNEVTEYAALLKTQSLDVLRDVLARETMSEGTDKVFHRILDSAGNEIFATEMASWREIPVSRTHVLAAAAGRTAFESLMPATRADPVRIIYGPIGEGWVLQIGLSTTRDLEMLRQFRQVFLLATILFTLCSIMLGAFMARRALRGVQEVTQTARNISAGNWGSRVPVSDRSDEIDELAQAFNEMIDHIQALIRELREVADDIAHDLRTPITRMRAAAESALDRGELPDQHQESAASLIEECDHLLTMINTTLEISQTEAGASRIHPESVDISGLIEEVADLFRTAAEDKQVALDCDDCPGLRTQGDPQRLRRAFAHLLDNAIKYTPSGGSVTIHCANENESVRVSIEDTGIGIPQENLDKIFDRFFRVDPSRSQSGNGLGLSLARAIFRAHGGDLTVDSVPGHGSTFVATLPRNES